MKNKTYINIIGVFFAAILLLTSCKKDDPVKLVAKVATWEISDITSTSAEISGYVIAEGAGFTERGICWNTSALPTITDQKDLVETVEGAVYVAQATGLSHLTKYYVRAYALSSDGSVIYGEDTSFTTLAHIPTVSVDAVSGITAYTATSGGNVSYDGKADVTARGVCWSMKENPTIEDNITEDGDGTGTFTSGLTGLVGGITYYARAYATNEMGTGYSDQVSFTTLSGIPVVTTDSIQDITKITAHAYGNALFTGGEAITERGFCWATTENPTIADNIVASTNGTGEFDADLTGLLAGTTYYVRAYATNSMGTAYGENISFVTIGEFFLVGSINGWNNHGLYTDYKGDGVFVAYQYLLGTDEFKFFPVRDSWDNGWGRDGTNPGTCVHDGGNIKASDEAGFSADGFYEIKFDATNQTVALTLITTMGVVGDAQSGGWDTDVNLTFNTTTKVWEGQVTFLSTGEYKFRANDDWDINFGGDLVNLVSGGANIATPGAGNFNISLDLSGIDSFNATVTAAK